MPDKGAELRSALKTSALNGSALSSNLPTPLPTRPVTPTALDPRQITSPAQISAQLALLSKRESELSLALNALVSDRSSLDGAMARLKVLGTDVQVLAREIDGPNQAGPSRAGALGLGNGNAQSVTGDPFYQEDEGLVERVRRVWETSERVGGKVRKLDEEVGRVRESTEVVTEVLELKVGPPTEPQLPLVAAADKTAA